MQWKLPKWQEKQKILFTEGKISQQKLESIVELAIQDQYFHEALSYIPKLESEDKKQSYLKDISTFAIDQGDLFLKNACSAQGYEISASELNLLQQNAQRLGKSFSSLKSEEEDDS
ncbi:MAG TPA: hypothetical protein PKC21_01155 [Oligoflexia bacterium]|nr:hypothetical protein [Oligoflexia bacterium]HMR23937.1 hypothetical protein [Oligoflexia bacterium]